MSEFDPISYGKASKAAAELAALSQQMADGLALSGDIQSETFTATAGQTIFTLTDTAGKMFLVIVENVPQTVGVGYTRTSDIIATLTSGATVGDTVTIYYYKASTTLVKKTQAEYDALTPDANTVYFITSA